MASVTLRGVSRLYAGTPAVTDVSLDVREGEFVVLLGPSGCGKTTTLRMIAGFVQPSAGTILIGGDDVTRVPPRRRDIGMVFQSYALFPNMSVAENVGFGLRERRLPAAEIAARIGGLLDLVRLTARSGARISELSGGQQQRVALARALAIRPRVLLMDEPLGALDLKLRESMQVELHRLQRELGITTILVTHDQQEAMSLADRIVIMAGGRIQQAGSAQDLYARPASRFVAGFIGKNNLLRAELVAAKSGAPALRVAGGVPIEAPIHSLRVGDLVDVSIRPEKIAMSRPGDGPGLPATITASRFLGSVIHYSVRTPGGEELLVERPAEGPQPAVGDAVVLGWKPEAAILFPATR